MVELQYPDTDDVVSVKLNSETVTVPSGELWDVSIWSTSEVGIPDTDDWRIAQGNQSPKKLLLPEGTEVYGGGTTLITGFNTDIENETVFEIEESGDTITVPSGEYWRVYLVSDNRAGIRINGDTIINNHEESLPYETPPMFNLTPGDEITVTQVDDSAAFVASGVKL